MSLVSLSRAVILVNWVVSPTGQLVLLVIMLRRGLVPRMRWFFVYTIWVMTTSLVQLPLYLQSKALGSVTAASFYVNWIADAGSIALGLLVVYEVFCDVFQPYEAFRRWAPALFRWCAVSLLLLGSAGALFSSPDHSLRIVAGLLILERTLRVVQVGLLLLVLITTRYLRITWKLNVLGVALGFGMYAAVAIVCTTLQAQNGPVAFWALNMVSSTAYTCAVLIWTAYCLARQPALEVVNKLPEVEEAQQWNQALSHLLQQ